MVSLNFQTPDLPMQLNQGKFEYNGNCGYQLKPEFLRRTDKDFDPFAETPVDGVIAAQCSVQVIAGQFLSDKKIGTYVEVDMYGLPTDTIRKEFRTKVVPANGLNPVYNEEPFVFRKVVLPDLAVLRIGVYDESGKMLGQRILPLDGLQAGYRHISLRTEGNFPMSLPMLFCLFDLKIYVPDGLGDFMTALSDPRAFLSGQEKRTEQMKAMGIEEADVQAAPTEGAAGAVGKQEQKKEEPVTFDAINADYLRKEKAFSKFGKKQQKELDSMRKKHMKDRQAMQKTQCQAMEKLAKAKKNPGDDDVHQEVRTQISKWSELINSQQQEEWQMLKEQIRSQEDTLKKLLEPAQAAQLKQLDVKFDKENKELKTKQAKVSVDTAKEVAADVTLKTKADKDRRLREKNQNNTKKFIEERKTVAMKQNREKEKLKKSHTEQAEGLSVEIKQNIELYEQAEVEYKLGPKEQFYV